MMCERLGMLNDDFRGSRVEFEAKALRDVEVEDQPRRQWLRLTLMAVESSEYEILMSETKGCERI